MKSILVGFVNNISKNPLSPLIRCTMLYFLPSCALDSFSNKLDPWETFCYRSANSPLITVTLFVYFVNSLYCYLGEDTKMKSGFSRLKDLPDEVLVKLL
jgi:hypothetical protein